MDAGQSIKSFVRNLSFNNQADDGRHIDFPKISIITPSYNQGRFLERTILSVLNQKYPRLEYIIMDGGSTDRSVEIIRNYEKYLTFWVSQKDNGQYHAINKGLEKATGEIIAWQNADDIYLPGTFFKVSGIFRGDPAVDIAFANMYLIDAADDILREIRFVPFYLDHLLYAGWNISSQIAFWSRRVMNVVGPFKELRHSSDFDWFIRLGKAANTIRYSKDFWGCYRMHPDTIFSRISFESRWPTIVSILREQGVPVRMDIPWVKQFRGKRAKILLRQIFHYLLQGDLKYMLRAAIKRRHILPR